MLIKCTTTINNGLSDNNSRWVIQIHFNKWNRAIHFLFKIIWHCCNKLKFSQMNIYNCFQGYRRLQSWIGFVFILMYWKLCTCGAEQCYWHGGAYCPELSLLSILNCLWKTKKDEVILLDAPNKLLDSDVHMIIFRNLSLESCESRMILIVQKCFFMLRSSCPQCPSEESIVGPITEKKINVCFKKMSLQWPHQLRKCHHLSES